MKRQLFTNAINNINQVSFATKPVDVVYYNGEEIWNNSTSFTCGTAMCTPEVYRGLGCKADACCSVFIPVTQLDGILPTCITTGTYEVCWIFRSEYGINGVWCQTQCPNIYAYMKVMRTCGKICNNRTVSRQTWDWNYSKSGNLRSSGSPSGWYNSTNRPENTLANVNGQWGFFVYDCSYNGACCFKACVEITMLKFVSMTIA